jgi:antitoxin (DNA-binding transcriptional repressor) of toxin-antitoxin stability system
MKVVEKADATATLAEYAEGIGSGPVIVTDQGQSVAALVPIENADLETVAPIAKAGRRPRSSNPSRARASRCSKRLAERAARS